MNEKISVEKFIDELLSKRDVEARKRYVTTHIKADYLPYEIKQAICNQIINSSCYTEVSGKKVYKQDSLLEYVLLCIALVMNYTDIELSDNKSDAFNELNRVGAFDYIINCLPKRQLTGKSDYDELSLMLRMLHDDIRENTRTVVGYIDSKFDTFMLLMENTLNDLAKASGNASESIEE